MTKKSDKELENIITGNSTYTKEVQEIARFEVLRRRERIAAG